MKTEENAPPPMARTVASVGPPQYFGPPLQPGQSVVYCGLNEQGQHQWTIVQQTSTAQQQKAVSHQMASLLVFALGFFFWPLWWGGTCLLCAVKKANNKTRWVRCLNTASIVLAVMLTVVIPVAVTLGITLSSHRYYGYDDDMVVGEGGCSTGLGCKLGDFCNISEATTLSECAACPVDQTCAEAFNTTAAELGSGDYTAYSDCAKYCESWCSASSDCAAYLQRTEPEARPIIVMEADIALRMLQQQQQQQLQNVTDITFCDVSAGSSAATCGVCPDLSAGETCADVVRQVGSSQDYDAALAECEELCVPCVEAGEYDDDCCATSDVAGCLPGFEYSAGPVCYSGRGWSAYETVCTPV